jgi:hypothetical protein
MVLTVLMSNTGWCPASCLEIWNEVNRLHLMNEGLRLRRKEVVLVPCSTELVFLFK